MTVFAVLVSCCAASATAGSFRGVIVRGPENHPGWIWVKGANGALRKVEVTSAHVVYDSAIPARRREKQPAKAMRAGVEVRVTADLDRNGEWKALKVEILRIGAAPAPQAHSQRAT